MLKSIKIQSHPSPSLSKMNHGMIPASSPESSHAAGFPFISVAIIGIIFATIFLLLCYYIFVIKCWHRNIPAASNSSPDPPTGLHESVIRSIPIFHFRKQKQRHSSDSECAVCLREFEDQEKLRIIPNCSHVFHIDCIDVWLQNNPNCPLCRNSISLEHPPRDDCVVIDLSVATKKLRKRHGYDSSMGDECISTRPKGGDDDDEEFLIQPIRRSFSMDSGQLYLAVQEIRNSLNHVEDVNDRCNSTSSSSSSNNNNRKLARGLFSFSHATSAILPVYSKP